MGVGAGVGFVGVGVGIGQLGDATFGRNGNLLADFLRLLGSDAVDVLKRNDDALVGRNVNARYTSHWPSPCQPPEGGAR